MKTIPFSLAILLSVLLSSASSQLLAQSCNSKIKATAPDTRFHSNQNGSVTDKVASLHWAACSFGKIFENGSCRGKAHQLPWAIVSLVIEPGWRLPTIVELNSLVEFRCIRPAINSTIFPNTEPAAYWSATRFINTDGNYWQVNFLHGESGSEPADAKALVRLVRDEP